MAKGESHHDPPTFQKLASRLNSIDFLTRLEHPRKKLVSAQRWNCCLIVHALGGPEALQMITLDWSGGDDRHVREGICQEQ